MKRPLYAAVGALCLLTALAEAQPQSPLAGSSAGAPAQQQGRKKRVAIFDFDYATVRQHSVAIFKSDIDVGKGVTDLLTRYLVENGTYSVIERKVLDKILAEQNFSNADRANPTSAAKLGKLLGVDAIIVGSVTQFGNETKNQNYIYFSKMESKAMVTLDARIVDIDSAEILSVSSGHGESSRKSTSLTGAGGGRSGLLSGQVDFGSSDFRNTIIGEAIDNATKQLSDGIIGNYAKLQARIIKVEGQIAAVVEGQVVLNVGAKTGVKVGDQLNVVRVGLEIKDPVTGQVIHRMTTPVGVIRLTEVDDISAVAVAVSGTDFKVGDAVKSAHSADANANADAPTKPADSAASKTSSAAPAPAAGTASAPADVSAEDRPLLRRRPDN